MKIIDFHSYLPNNALKELNVELKRNDILVLICGYGSNNTSSKIRNLFIRELKMKKEKSEIKDFFVGSELNISSKGFNDLEINKKNKLNKYLLDPRIIGMIFVII